MFELNKILSFTKAKFLLDQQVVLATIIRTEGSTYRKQGTQMVVAEDLTFEGAISGGCVENEVIRQATSIFGGGQNLIFEYDGRYKLGCNGKIHLLLEKIDQKQFEILVEKVAFCETERRNLQLGIHKISDSNISYYRFEDLIVSLAGSELSANDLDDDIEIPIEPQDQVIILGSEYDAILLAKFSSQAGFKTYLVGKDVKRPADHEYFVMNIEPEELNNKISIDEHSAVIVMTHSFSRDLHFLKHIINEKPGYLGILGPADRRDRLISDLMEMEGTDMFNLPDNIYAPIGLDIGASMPEEISISILSEIIAVFRKGKAHHLKDRIGSIHLENQ